MTPMELNQRCWNHEAREAACRCPACGRTYCRECVSEHEGRLLCAACLRGLATGREQETGVLRRLAPPGMIAVGILLAWLIYWAAGASLIGVIRRLEQEPEVGQTIGFCRLPKGRAIAKHDRPGKAMVCPTYHA